MLVTNRLECMYGKATELVVILMMSGVGTDHLDGLSVDGVGVGRIDAMGTAISRFVSVIFPKPNVLQSLK